MDTNSIATKKDLQDLYIKIICDLKDLIYKKFYPEKAFFTPKEFEKLTGIRYSTVVYKCKNGLIKARQDSPNSTWLIDANELERFKKEAFDNV
jgi:hypothetical protein